MKKTYKVTFKGIIFPGFDKDQVVKNIHSITRIPKHTITRKFFSGKTVVIRHADSQDYANHLQKTFAQAGIETYISEVYETKEDEHSNLNHIYPVNENDNYDSRIKKSNIRNIIYVVIFIVLAIISINHFLLTDSKTNNTINKPEFPSVETKQLTPIVKKPIIVPVREDTKIPPPSFSISESDIRKLIKITEQHELKNLFHFVHLFGFNPEYINILKQVIESDKSKLMISKETPLYIIQANKYISILMSKKNELSNHFISELRKEINNVPVINNVCAKNKPVKIINTEKHLFFTNNNNSDFIKEIKFLSNNNHLNKQFFKYDLLLAHNDNNESAATFHFYYSNMAEINNKTDNFAISSNSTTFWLTRFPDTIVHNNELSDYLKLDKNKSNKLSSLKNINLFQFALLIMSQNIPENLFNSQSHDLDFEPEHIITLNNKKSVKNLRNYQNKLDIEFNVQWQSGPFAITTNKFKFDKKLIIELLAKGQNIDNIMEYSHSASINTESVLNNSGDNILLENCLENKSNIAYFMNHKGEQEAFIDDDFIKYKTITASNQIALKPGFITSDISQVEGKIKLQLPEEILNKSIDITTLQALNQDNIEQFENFSILFKAQAKNNMLKYKVIGDINKFITIRAYDKSGEILETESIKKKLLVNHQIAVYQHIFSESIASIQVFYTNKNNFLVYPFSFKPSIIPARTPLNRQDEEEIVFNIQAENNNFNLDTLNKQVLEDNPDWLGEKFAQTIQQPFYISLFIRNDSDSDSDIYDAVLNIKSTLLTYISQNLSAVKLTLTNDNEILLNNFVSFTINELLNGEAVVNSDGSIAQVKTSTYLNSYSAFQLNKDSIKNLRGTITFNLPTSFKVYSSSYSSPGQIIKSDNLVVTLIQINKHQAQFKIKGLIKNLVQLKLYNKQAELISEPFEFQHLNNDTAILTLRYNDQIDTIKLVLSHETIVRDYPFSFTSPLP